VAEFIGSMLGHMFLLSILYAGSGSSDRPLLRSVTFNAFMTVLVVFLAGVGGGSGSQLNFENWEMRALAGLAVSVLDHLRLRGKLGLKRNPRTLIVEASHRTGILWTAISAASFFAFGLAGMLIASNMPGSSIGSVLYGFAVIALVACPVAYPISRMVAWTKAPKV
jgi:hypothetical protein